MKERKEPFPIPDYFRYGRKFVVLDCSATLASEIIIQHVKDVHLGRRNYHYLLSGLVGDK